MSVNVCICLYVYMSPPSVFHKQTRKSTRMEKGVTAGKEKDAKASEMLYSCSICEHKCQKKITMTEHTNAQSMES